MAVLTTREKRKVQRMNPTSNDVQLQDRIDRLDTDGRVQRTVTAKTATATLTAAEVSYGLISATDASTAIVLTLPAASATLAQSDVIIGMGGAAGVKVKCTAGFGGGGGSYDHATLALGMALQCVCDGTNWYVVNVTVCAGT